MALFKKSNIKVLMVGGRRCGKTSALASMFNQMINGLVNSFFTVANSTVYVKGKISPITGQPEDQDTLESKNAELQNFLDIPNARTFLVDSGPTYCTWTYKLKLLLPGTRRNMEIEFLDCPGEFFQAGMYDEKTNKFVEDSDVFVVMVDTPYLMDATKGVCNAVNCIPDLQNFLTHIKNDEGEKAKMVVFVPIKCEKWIKEKKIDDVSRRIEEVYATTIKALRAYNRMNICIIPIETAGNILFSEFKDAYTVSSSTGTERCCKLSETMIRKADGTIMRLKPEYIINKDMEAVVKPTTVIRPYAWYHINMQAEGDLYVPHNCDQLPLHILEFITKKLSEEGRGVFTSWLIGDISRDTMEQKLRQIQDRGLIKVGVDGIRYIKKDI